MLQLFHLLGYTHWKPGDASSGSMMVSSTDGMRGCCAMSSDPKIGCWMRSSKGLNGDRAASLMSPSRHDLKKPMVKRRACNLGYLHKLFPRRVRRQKRATARAFFKWRNLIYTSQNSPSLLYRHHQRASDVACQDGTRSPAQVAHHENGHKYLGRPFKVSPQTMWLNNRS